MKIAMAEEMREIDRKTIEEYGIPGVVLMENAGAAVARYMEKILGDVTGKRITILAGKGNNGGDGFVVARYLANRGAKVKVFLFSEQGDVAGDAAVHLDVLLQMGIDILEISAERDWDRLKVSLSFSDCLVDALLGTGMTGELYPVFSQAIEAINKAGKLTFAIDLPSGVQANDGRVISTAVKADHTITLGLAKPGLFLYPGTEYAGQVVIDDIGIPAALLCQDRIRQNVLTATDMVTKIPLRYAESHKGDCGWALVLGGSEGYTGAAALTAAGALRAGTGRVTLGVAESIYPILAAKLTEAMVTPLPGGTGAILTPDSLPGIELLAENVSVVAIGPGLGRTEETLNLVRELVHKVDRPFVIDADALYAVTVDENLFQESPALCVLTPHPGEMAAMTGLSVKEIQENRLTVAKEYAEKWQSIVVLKGAATIIAFPDGELYINSTGNAGMATGGMGDVLTGMIAAFIAQGCSSHEAALLGVYLHGLAGDLVAKSNPIGMAASDVAEVIPAAIYGLLSEK
ncbi:MAG: NAD(P)H-hydrate dehydratase [Sporomusaceae bacterium]|nr:NAD(P)H-hydrate dehydratase [Sporomusaceae bacterium]